MATQATEYRRCSCRTGDHNLDGTLDRCLNNAGYGHRLCSDCRLPRRRRVSHDDKARKAPFRPIPESELRALWGDR